MHVPNSGLTRIKFKKYKSSFGDDFWGQGFSLNTKLLDFDYFNQHAAENPGCDLGVDGLFGTGG
jgi:hypothetical protein